MAKLFGVDIAKEVASAMGSGLLAATLTHYTPGERTSGAATSGTTDRSSSHTARGFVDRYSDSQIDGTLIRRGDRRVVLLGKTITPEVVPAPGDEITIEGETLRIVPDGVSTDPAKAAYECQARAV